MKIEVLETIYDKIVPILLILLRRITVILTLIMFLDRFHALLMTFLKSMVLFAMKPNAIKYTNISLLCRVWNTFHKKRHKSC